MLEERESLILIIKKNIYKIIIDTWFKEDQFQQMLHLVLLQNLNRVKNQLELKKVKNNNKSFLKVNHSTYLNH